MKTSVLFVALSLCDSLQLDPEGALPPGELENETMPRDNSASLNAVFTYAVQPDSDRRVSSPFLGSLHIHFLHDTCISRQVDRPTLSGPRSPVHVVIR